MTQVLESRNPANGELVGEVPVTPVASVAGVVDAARAARGAWSALPLEERGERLERAGRRLMELAEPLGEQLSREMGKPLDKGVGEVRNCGRSMAEKVGRAIAALRPVVHNDPRVETTIFYDPLGVCAAISPWNYPMSMCHWMLVPALMAGNAVVLKPSDETPLTAQAYAEVLGAELPPGVLQVMHGRDAQGKALVADDGVDLVVFTGSRAAGKHIMASAAARLKRLVLELGGKDPLIVLDDADLDAAARFAVDNSFENSGQMCVSTERVFVAAEVAEAFEQKVAERAGRVRWGPWNEADVSVGPMVNEAQRSHVIAQIDQAVAAGARRLVGDAAHPARYVVPTVLADVDEAMAIAQEETFGPVVCISRFDDVEQALAAANGSRYGLGAVVFGGDEERAWRVARRLEAGMIGVNKSLFGAGDTPWVGAKESGYGYHGSPDGYRQFAQARAISRPMPPTSAGARPETARSQGNRRADARS
jgi:acyl-CoA reductase-like NAD-dependent aldehyde dehydrogenase